jgi:hypothetical protein
MEPIAKKRYKAFNKLKLKQDLAAFHRVFSAWPLVRNSSSSVTEEGIFVTKSRKLSGDRDSFSIVVVGLIYLSDENVIC